MMDSKDVVRWAEGQTRDVPTDDEIMIAITVLAVQWLDERQNTAEVLASVTMENILAIAQKVKEET